MTHEFLPPENVMPTGESFKFTALGLSQVYTADKVGEDMRITIRWVDADGFSHVTDYGVEVARKHIENGAWIVLPSAQTAEQAFEDAFSSVQGIVKIPSKSSGSLLEAIKTFTREVNASVFIVDGTYEIYTQEQVCRASSNEQMENLMGAIRIVEKSLVDGL